MGGLAVPITRETTVAHWVRRLNLPILIVAHPWLGTLNHTILTFNYAQNIGLQVLGVVLNCSLRKKDISMKTNAQALDLLGIPVIGILPFVSGTMEEKVKKLKQHSSGQKMIAWIEGL